MCSLVSSRYIGNLLVTSSGWISLGREGLSVSAGFGKSGDPDLRGSMATRCKSLSSREIDQHSRYYVVSTTFDWEESKSFFARKPQAVISVRMVDILYSD